MTSSSISSIIRIPPLLQRCSWLHGSSQCQHNPVAYRSRSSSPVNLFGAGPWSTVGGGEGFNITGWGVTLVLRASWFNCSSWCRAKEMADISVSGCRALTSPRISGFKPSIKVHNSYFCDQSWVWLDNLSNLVWYSWMVEVCRIFASCPSVFS